MAGDGAALVDPYSVASIRAGFQQIIENEAYRNALVERGYLNSKRFDNVAIAKQYISIYESLHS